MQRSILKKIYNVFITMVVIVLALLAILLAGVRLVGLMPYAVLSGSMRPTYQVGSIIYVREVNPWDLKVDDPVTYRIEGGTVVTHRIIEVIEDETISTELSFRTQGDANKEPDGSLLPAQNIIGKPVFHIPLLGYVSTFIQNPRGMFVILGGCIILFLIMFISDMLFVSNAKTHSNKNESI